MLKRDQTLNNKRCSPITIIILGVTSTEMEGWDIKALREYVAFSTSMEEASNRYDAILGSRLDGVEL